MQILFCGSLSFFVFNYVFNNSESRLMENFLLCHKNLVLDTCIRYTVFLLWCKVTTPIDKNKMALNMEWPHCFIWFLRRSLGLDLNFQSFCRNIFLFTFFFQYSGYFPYVDLVSHSRDKDFLVLSNFAKCFMDFKYLLYKLAKYWKKILPLIFKYINLLSLCA